MGMFGYVTASLRELTKEQSRRYSSVYCGICRRIRVQSENVCRLALQYDMAFLALLLMSLYEPEEAAGKRACGLHPLCPRPWVDNEFVEYAADMNVLLAFWKAEDDWQDDHRRSAKWLRDVFGKYADDLRARWPRQYAAVEENLQKLSRLEKENCANPDLPAGCFGALMAELLVYQEDLWAPTLRKLGMALGRFIYLADAAEDYAKDKKKGKYNPFLAMEESSREMVEEALVLCMAACTREFEKLPLVQDKKLLDNILYSGVWCNLHRQKTKEGGRHG